MKPNEKTNFLKDIFGVDSGPAHICSNCGLYFTRAQSFATHKCLPPLAQRFMEENKGLMEDLAKMEELERGTKNDSGKPALSLVPPLAFLEVGRGFEAGQRKYGTFNYMKGLTITRLTGGSLRHMFQFLAGEDYDKETGVHHLACVVTNALMALEMILQGRKELDDRYKPDQK